MLIETERLHYKAVLREPNLGSANESNGTETVTKVIQRFPASVNNIGMRGETQVVIRTEVQHLTLSSY